MFGHLEYFRTFINIHFYHHKRKLPSPSQIETRGSFATITDGKCGLIDCLAFYFMRRLELVDRWKWVGYCLLLLFVAAVRLVSHGI